jgi:2-oxoglutarate decarboxylase
MLRNKAAVSDLREFTEGTFRSVLEEPTYTEGTGIKRISRRAMSAPSSGSSKVHAVEQQEIIDEAFAS